MQMVNGELCLKYKKFEDWLHDEELKPFMVWAFGEDWEDIRSGLEMIQCWNNLHLIEFRLSSYGKINADVPLMIDLWHEESEE